MYEHWVCWTPAFFLNNNTTIEFVCFKFHFMSLKIILFFPFFVLKISCSSVTIEKFIELTGDFFSRQVKSKFVATARKYWYQLRWVYYSTERRIYSIDERQIHIWKIQDTFEFCGFKLCTYFLQHTSLRSCVSPRI